MRRWIIGFAALRVGACSPLSAITGGPGATRADDTLKALGEQIEKCDRSYQGGFGLGGSFTFNIDCKAQPTPED